jgi:hypothetical protein
MGLRGLTLCSLLPVADAFTIKPGVLLFQTSSGSEILVFETSKYGVGGLVVNRLQKQRSYDGQL